MEIRKINSMSDFDAILRLSDCEGNEIGWPECDWRAEFFTASGVGIYRASCIGGECRNCFNDGGRIHVVFKDHRMGVGTLQCRLTLDLPDGIYPDGIRRDVSPAPLGVELVNGAGDCPRDITLDLTLPVVYLTAYDLAVRAGYAGTLAEYIGYVNRFPQVVETSEMLGRMLSDLDDGKARIADALTRQGEPTDRSEPMAAMADKVLGLRLAVPGEPGVIDQSGGGRLEHTDLLNLLRNSVRAATPFCYGVRHALNSVTLMGADAYLCSDGFFTEAGGVHEFSGGGDRWIIYYFRNADYMVTAPTPCIEIVALNGRPQFELSAVTVPTVRSYTDEKYTLEAASGYAFGATAEISLAGTTLIKRQFANVQIVLQSLMLPDLEECGTMLIYNCNTMKTISFPSLKRVTGSTGIVYTCSGITEVNTPSLDEISGGSLVTTMSALRRLELPSLRRVSGGHIAHNCAALTELSLPVLEEITGGTSVNICHALEEIDFPALRSITEGSLVSGANSLVRIGLPALESITTKNTTTKINSCPELEEIEFPSLKTVTIGTVQMNIIGTCTKLSRVSFPALDFIGGGDRKNMMIVYGAASPHLVVDLPVCRSFAASCYGADGHVVELRFGAAIQSIWVYLSVRTTILRLSVTEGAVTSIDTNWGGSNPLVWDEESLHETLRRLGDNTEGDTLAIKIGAAMIALLSEEEIASVTARNYSLS
ncbi:MAG: leucine-rich repeat protein [Muribaculaceae bacterium]|nr:leucine-rich repeat protein [Muribaculaceae bacterium]